MAKYVSGRQKNLKVGISSYSENLTSLEVIGNVGIATTNATSKLYVVGDGYFTGIVTASNFSVRNSLVGAAGSFSQLNVSGITTFINGPVLVGTATSTGTVGQVLQVSGINSSVYIGGNLGIGTTNPTSKLHVVGDGNFTGVVTATTFNGQINAGISTISVNSSTDALRITQTGSGNALVVEDSANPDSSPFVVKGDGSVGIGTASPAFTADIAGDARVTSTNKMRFGGTAGTTNFYIQYNSTANSLDFVAG
jgi:hypothetical protein